MGKKVIRILVDGDLLGALAAAQEKVRPDAEVIRDAGWPVLRQREEERLDREYEEGYRQIPEALTLAEAAASMAGEVLNKETW
jgi:hypothetical protein